MKQYHEDIEVIRSRDGCPQTIYWRRRRYVVVTILETWRYNGKWWTGRTLLGVNRFYYRLTCRDMARTCLEIEIYRQAERWVLARTLD